MEAMTETALATAPPMPGLTLISELLEPRELALCAICGFQVDDEAWQRDVWDRVVHQLCAAGRPRIECARAA